MLVQPDKPRCAVMTVLSRRTLPCAPTTASSIDGQVPVAPQATRRAAHRRHRPLRAFRSASTRSRAAIASRPRAIATRERPLSVQTIERRAKPADRHTERRRDDELIGIDREFAARRPAEPRVRQVVREPDLAAAAALDATERSRRSDAIPRSQCCRARGSHRAARQAAAALSLGVAAGFEPDSHIGELNAVAVAQQIRRAQVLRRRRRLHRRAYQWPFSISPRHQLDLFGRQMTHDQRAVQRALEHVHFHDDVAGTAAAELQLIEMNHRIQQVPARA